MARHGSWTPRDLGRCAAALAAIVGAAALLMAATAQSVFAVPHTISNHQHPYDPDWLDIRLMLGAKCNGCHRAANKQTDFTSYENVMAAGRDEGEPVVVPGRPDQSPFLESVLWNFSGQRNSDRPDRPKMPSEMGEWLTDGQQEIIRRWIAHGALQYKLPGTCSPRPLMETDFPSAKECRACHPRQFEQWSRSMHAYAQHSPIFEALNLTLQERSSGTLGTFCSRCHTPLGTLLGENGLRRNVYRSRLSMEGVTCVVCHRIKRPYYKANSRHHIAPGKLTDGCMYGPFVDPVSADGVHNARGRPFIKTAAFCGSCHDVTIPGGVRLEEAFSEWQNSPAAKQGITCQSCHMGPVQGVPTADCQRPLGRAATVPGLDPSRLPLRRLSDHTFAGPDYSLLPDTEFPYKLDWMYEVDYRRGDLLTAHQRKTLADLRRKNRRQLSIATTKRYEVLRNAARLRVKAPRTAAEGEKIKVRVDVKSIFAGHNFPTGFTAERQCWVRIVLLDPTGCAIFVSGDVDRNGDLRDEHSHQVESGKLAVDHYLLNFQSKFVALTNKGTERQVVLSANRHLQPLSFIRPAAGVAVSFGRPGSFRLSKASLIPFSSAGRTYPIRLPKRPGRYHLQVRLNFRHLPPVLLDKIGAPHLKHLLETVVIDRFDGVIHVGSGKASRLGSKPLTFAPLLK